MTEDDVREIVVFVRSRQPKFSSETLGHPYKIMDGDFYNCGLYNRREQLLKGSREYDEAMDEIYIKTYLDDKKDKTPDEQT